MEALDAMATNHSVTGSTPVGIEDADQVASDVGAGDREPGTHLGPCAEAHVRLVISP